MKRLATVYTIFTSAYFVSKMLGSLLLVWLTLRWKVKRARRSFESELIKQGMSREDAERLSHCFLDLKNEMMKTVRNAFGARGKHRD